MTMFRRGQPSWRIEDDLLDWFYVRYRHVYLVLGLCALLVAGWGAWRLAAQAEPTPPALAGTRFLLVDGAVTVRKAGHADWVPAHRATALGRYDLVRTGPRGIAEILFPDQSVVHVRPDSLISLQGRDRDAASGRQVAWHISAGEVFMRAAARAPAAPAPSSAFSTPAARGTLGQSAQASLRVDDAGASELRQFAGSTRLETRSGAVLEVASSQGVRVDGRGRAEPKVHLPPPPDLLEPPHQAKVAGAAAAGKVLLTWRPVPGAESYRLEMDRSAYFSGPFVSRRGLTETSVEVRGLDHGQYYWRVASEGAPRMEGRFSDYARLTVSAPEEARDVPPPPLQLERLAMSSADILHVKGSTAPGTSVTVNGRRLAVHQDGSFSEFLQLDEEGPQTVAIRATSLDGGMVTHRLPVAVAP